MEFSCKQKRSFHTVLSGLKLAKFGRRRVRFLTLTTSLLSLECVPKQDLNQSFQVLRKRILRYSPARLVLEGYISRRKALSVYGHDCYMKPFSFEYFKVHTNEGNGVLHVLYRGSYLPYNFLVDNWQDIHLSWDLHIMEVDLADPRSASLYVVSQYVGGQGCSYVRSSQSHNWVFYGFKSAWSNLKHRFCYNPFLSKYYLNHCEVNIFSLWDDVLRRRASNFFCYQSKLDFG